MNDGKGDGGTAGGGVEASAGTGVGAGGRVVSHAAAEMRTAARPAAQLWEKRTILTGLSQQGDNDPYVVTKDRSRFLLSIAGPDSGGSPDLAVVMNWPATAPN